MKFNSSDQVRQYLAHRRIECFECGLRYVSLVGHLGKKHAMSSAEYRERYGIPAHFWLASSFLCEKVSQNARDNPELMQRAKRLAKDFYSDHDRSAAQKNDLVRREMAERLHLIRRGHPPVNKGVPTEFSINGRPENDIEWDCSFVWHIEMAKTNYQYDSIQVPRGKLSWQTFQKRRLKDEMLNAKFKAARDACRGLGLIPTCPHGDADVRRDEKGRKNCRICQREAQRVCKERKRSRLAAAAPGKSGISS